MALRVIAEFQHAEPLGPAVSFLYRRRVRDFTAQHLVRQARQWYRILAVGASAGERRRRCKSSRCSRRSPRPVFVLVIRVFSVGIAIGSSSRREQIQHAAAPEHRHGRHAQLRCSGWSLGGLIDTLLAVYDVVLLFTPFPPPLQTGDRLLVHARRAIWLDVACAMCYCRLLVPSRHLHPWHAQPYRNKNSAKPQILL